LIWRMPALQQHLRMPLDRPSSTMMTDYPEPSPSPHAICFYDIYLLFVPPCGIYVSSALLRRHSVAPRNTLFQRTLLKTLIPIYRCSNLFILATRRVHLPLFLSSQSTGHIPHGTGWYAFAAFFLKLPLDVMILRARTILGLAVWDGFLAHCMGTWESRSCHCLEFDMGPFK
jgi:hypothetical protein